MDVHARRITWTLFGAQSLGSAGFLGAATVSPIVATALSGRATWAGAPGALFQMGGGLAALLWGHCMDRYGRRPTLASGLFAGAAGAALGAWGVATQALALFLLGALLMGSANSALQLGRFVAAEVHAPPRRGRALATVVLGGTVGAVLGPLLAQPSARLARERGMAELGGPFVASAGLLALAGLLLLTRLRPEPRELALARAAEASAPRAESPAGASRRLEEILRDPLVRVAMTSLVFGQAVMVMLMVITAVHMTRNQHPLGNVSLVISCHVVGMYGLSLFSGRLADRMGRLPLIALGGALLALACLAAPLSVRLPPLAASLFLLGLGWNFCYVGGSALLSDRLAAAERARTQGVNDSLIGLASAAGSLGSGVVFAAVGFATMGVLAALAALLPFALALGARLRPLQPAA